MHYDAQGGYVSLMNVTDNTIGIEEVTVNPRDGGGWKCVNSTVRLAPGELLLVPLTGCLRDEQPLAHGCRGVQTIEVVDLDSQRLRVDGTPLAVSAIHPLIKEYCLR